MKVHTYSYVHIDCCLLLVHKVYVPLFISIHSDKTIVTPHEAYDETNDTWNHNKSDINYKAGVARYVETMKSYY